MIESVCFLKPWEKCELLWRVTPQGKGSCWDHWHCEHVWLLFSQESTSHHWIGSLRPTEKHPVVGGQQSWGKGPSLIDLFRVQWCWLWQHTLHSTFHLCLLLYRAWSWCIKYDLLDVRKPNQRFELNFFPFQAAFVYSCDLSSCGVNALFSLLAVKCINKVAGHKGLFGQLPLWEQGVDREE